MITALLLHRLVAVAKFVDLLPSNYLPILGNDNSGPQGLDPLIGLPKLRSKWIQRREAAGDKTPTQMWYAKRGKQLAEISRLYTCEHHPAKESLLRFLPLCLSILKGTHSFIHPPLYIP